MSKIKSDPMNDLSGNRLIKFTFVVFKVAEISLPAYSCEYSKQTYTQHQLMALICLMKRLRLKYREIVEVVDLMPKLQEIIGLKEIPHFTTLQKFFKRFGSHFFDEMLDQTVELFYINNPWVTIDGTGHSTDHASLYYAHKTKKQHKKKRKSYTKNQIAIDTQKQVILSCKVARGPGHDSRDAIPTIRKTSKYKPVGFSLDKAFKIQRILMPEKSLIFRRHLMKKKFTESYTKN